MCSLIIDRSIAHILDDNGSHCLRLCYTHASYCNKDCANTYWTISSVISRGIPPSSRIQDLIASIEARASRIAHLSASVESSPNDFLRNATLAPPSPTPASTITENLKKITFYFCTWVHECDHGVAAAHEIYARDPGFDLTELKNLSNARNSSRQVMTNHREYLCQENFSEENKNCCLESILNNRSHMIMYNQRAHHSHMREIIMGNKTKERFLLYIYYTNIKYYFILPFTFNWYI